MLSSRFIIERLSHNFSFGESTLRFRGKSGLLAAFLKAIPQTNRVLGMAQYSKNPDYRGCRGPRSDGGLQGIKIHEGEFLYDFVLKRNKLQWREFRTLLKENPVWGRFVLGLYRLQSSTGHGV
jgi:hypothetical protein